MKITAFLATLVAGVFMATSAWASPVSWAVNYANVQGNLAVTGSFAYDADTNMFSDINVLATDNSTISNTIYTLVSSISSPTAGAWVFRMARALT